MRVARWSGALSAWESELSGLKRRIGPVFGRREVRETAVAFLDGLLSGVERKTGWLLSEQAGLEHPTRMQALLGRTRWEADALRDQVRAYVLEARASSWPRPLSWRASPPTCAEPPGMLPISLPRSPTKRTKGVQRPKLPEPPLCPPAERARDPRPPGSPGLQVADPDNLHPRLVALAKAPPSPSRPRSLQAATTCATVVLVPNPPARAATRKGDEGCSQKDSGLW